MSVNFNSQVPETMTDLLFGFFSLCRKITLIGVVCVKPLLQSVYQPFIINWINFLTHLRLFINYVKGCNFFTKKVRNRNSL